MNYEWSENQKKILDVKNYKEGKIIVKACPGSGKTTCTSERIVKLIQEFERKQQGLAILSFTNVAINEINTYYEEKLNKSISFPNYIGTIDSFINKYIFLPYGYLVMDCYQRPLLVGEPHSKWDSIFYKDSFFDKLSYDIEGNIIRLENKIPKDGLIFKRKKILNKKGYATQDDSNYFSMKILKEYPQIAEIIINKFPYFIIDESQDMSSIQMEILNILISNGLKNVLLVGDPNQAIFEWKTAEPNLFNKKYEQWNKKHKAINLNDSFRCSESICNYLSKLSGNEITSKLNDDNNHVPIISDDEDNLNDIIEKFIEEVDEKNIDKENIAVLFRSKMDMKRLNNPPKFKVDDIFKDSSKDIDEFKKHMKSNENLSDKNIIKSYSRNIIKGMYHLLHNNFQKSFKEFEEAYLKVMLNRSYDIHTEKIKLIDKCGFYKYKKDVFEFMKHFKKPKTGNDLIDEWIVNNNEIFKENVDNKLYIDRIKTKDKSGIKLNKKLTWNMLDNDDYQEYDNIFIGTIHSAKGKTFDAVLLILNSNCTNLLGERLEDEEELRNLYVGMSRARYYLHMVVPNKYLDKWKSFFENNEKQHKLEDFF